MSICAIPETEIECVPGVSPAAGTYSKILAGTSALGTATAVERGLSLAASILAARCGGASVFGSYSLALATANNISAYTGSGIGNTAVRFAAAHSRDSVEYGPMTRALLLVMSCSAALAAILMLLAASPMAHFVLKNDGLGRLLQLSALSAGAIIALECSKGFLLGQRAHKPLVLVCLLAGCGLLAVLPLAAQSGAGAMVFGHGTVILSSVLICIVFAGPLGLRPSIPNHAHQPLGPVVREVWGFGMVQLTSLLGMNIAGWWLTSMVARSDPSMVQTGLFAVAHQIRNIAALVPAMIGQSAYALLAERRAHHDQDAARVTSVCNFGTNTIAVLIAGAGILAAPYLLPAVYGSSYRAAVLPTLISLATAVAHLGSAPIAGRLNILDVRRSGFVNLVWAAVVASAATVLVQKASAAVDAACIYLAAFVVASWLNVWFLRRYELPKGTWLVTLVSQAGISLLTLLGCLRVASTGSELLYFPASLLVLAGTLFVLVRIAQRHGWIPGQLRAAGLLAALTGRAQ